jgi:hypothetical protein
MPHPDAPSGAGLGFRAPLAEALLSSTHTAARFVELSPENYLGVGGRRARLLAMARERFPIVCHGLCGDFAGSGPIDDAMLTTLRSFLREQHARWYSDHLCLTHVAGVESHDLLPLPFSDDAVTRAAARIRTVRERLELPLAVENVSAYLRMPGGTMDEAAFINAVCEQADCGLLLDVNNVYVNAVNFGFDARACIDALPLHRVVQLHIAGHEVEIEGELVVDTHGAPIIDPVYDLLAYVLPKLPRGVPVLLERDHNIPPLHELEVELQRIQAIAEAAHGQA